MDAPLTILHRDEHLVLLDKPPGIVVHPGWAIDGGGLVRMLREQLGQPVWPVHRLDRATSGVLALALSAESAAALGRAFADGRVDKRYLALVRGHPPESVVVDHPVPARPDGPRVPAVTELRRLGVWGRYALVEARPRTGRLHQIRRHLKHLSCPIIGDVNYGKGEHNRLFRREHGLNRLALHALALRLPHPITGAPVVGYAAPSGTLAACLAAIGLGAAVPGPEELGQLQTPFVQSDP
jgi:tRNA pseudouridine65 synthase